MKALLGIITLLLAITQVPAQVKYVGTHIGTGTGLTNLNIFPYLVPGAGMNFITNGDKIIFSSAGGVTNNQYLPGVPVANGQGFTNLNGGNVQAGTVSSNQIAPTILAQLGSGTVMTNASPQPFERPFLGWSSFWDANVGGDVDLSRMNATTVTNIALLWHTNGFQAAGWNVIWIDEGWEAWTRDGSGNLQANPTNFPNAPGLVSWLHSLGYQVGWYTSLGSAQCGTTCAGQPTSAGNEMQDARYFVDTLGVDAIKVDLCGAFNDQTSFPIWGAALSPTNVSRQIFALFTVNWQWPWLPLVANAYQDGLSALIRTGPSAFGNVVWTAIDLYHGQWFRAGWEGYETPNPELIGPYHFKHSSVLSGTNTANVIRSGFSMFAMLCNPVLIDGPTTSAATDAIWTNREIIAVLQDEAVRQAVYVTNYSGIQVWRKILGWNSSSAAICLFNTNSSDATCTVTLTDMGFVGGCTLRDIVNHTNIGSFNRSYFASIPAQDVLMMIATPSSSPIGSSASPASAALNHNEPLVINERIESLGTDAAFVLQPRDNLALKYYLFAYTNNIAWIYPGAWFNPMLTLSNGSGNLTLTADLDYWPSLTIKATRFIGDGSQVTGVIASGGVRLDANDGITVTNGYIRSIGTNGLLSVEDRAVAGDYWGFMATNDVFWIVSSLNGWHPLLRMWTDIGGRVHMDYDSTWNAGPAYLGTVAAPYQAVITNGTFLGTNNFSGTTTFSGTVNLPGQFSGAKGLTLLFEGDSNMADDWAEQALHRRYSWPALLGSRHITPSLNYRNYSNRGDTATNMVTEFPAHAGTFIPSIQDYQNSYYFFAAGINDLNTGGTATNIFLAISNNLALAKAAVVGPAVLTNVLIVPTPWWSNSGIWDTTTGSAYTNWVALTNLIWTLSANLQADYIIDTPVIMGNKTVDTVHYTEEGAILLVNAIDEIVFGTTNTTVSTGTSNYWTANQTFNATVSSTGGSGFNSQGSGAGYAFYSRNGDGKFKSFYSETGNDVLFYDSNSSANIIALTNSSGNWTLDLPSFTTFKIGRKSAGQPDYYGNHYTIAPTNGIAAPPSVEQPLGLFGSIMMANTTNTLAVTQGVYAGVTNYSTVRTNGFHVNAATGWMTNTVAGFYRIGYYASCFAGASDVVELEVEINGTGREEISGFQQWDAGTVRVKSLSGFGVLYLPANSYIRLTTNNRTSATSVVFWRCGLTCGTP